MRRAARVDATASDLVKHARALGAYVYLIGGTLDAFLWHRGQWHAVDFKSPKGELTAAQGKMVAAGVRVHFVSTTEQTQPTVRGAMKNDLGSWPTGCRSRSHTRNVPQ